MTKRLTITLLFVLALLTWPIVWIAFAADNQGAALSHDKHNPFSDNRGLQKSALLDQGGSEYFEDAAGDSNELDFTGSFTVSGWYRITAEGSFDHVIYDKSNSVNMGYRLYYDISADEFAFEVFDGSGTTTVTSASFSAAPLGIWIWVCGTHENGTQITIRINDDAEQTTAFTTGTVDATQQMHIGSDVAETFFADGNIAGVGVWGRELTDDEKNRVYGGGRGQRGQDLDGTLNNSLAAYYDLSELDSTRADSGPNGLDLTAINSPVNAAGPSNHMVTEMNGTDSALSSTSFGSTSPADLAYCFWLKPTGTPNSSDYYFYYGSDAAGDGENNYIYATSSTNLAVAWSSQIVNVTIAADSWYCIVVFFDYGTEFRVYSNGAFIGTGTAAFTNGGSDFLSLGNLIDGGPRLWAPGDFHNFTMWEMGTMPDATDRLAMAGALYNGGAAVSLEEMRNSGDSDFHVGKMIHHWPLDEQAGDVTDVIGGEVLSETGTVKRSASDNQPHIHNPQSSLLLNFEGADDDTTTFDQGRADDTNDTVTMNGNMSITTAHVHSTNGSTSHAAFDGTGDYGSIPDSSAFDLDGDFTLMVWAWNWTSSFTHIICVQATDANNRWRWYFQTASGGQRFQSTSGGILNISPSSGDTSFSAETWYHLAVTRQGNTFTFYRDGEAAGSGTDTDDVVLSSSNFLLGINYDLSSNPWNGYLDGFTINNSTALSARQIKAIFNATELQHR